MEEEKSYLKTSLPGDKIYRPTRRKKPRGLRRILGIGGLYSIGYGNVGSSIYYALGITAVYALGATPIALGISGVFFIFTALTYAEGTAMIPEAGGSSSFARRAFNEMVSFVAGWVLMLDYIVTIAISAITVPFYLSYFWPVLKTSHAAATWVGIGIIVFLMLLNTIGIKESSAINVGFCLLDLVTQAGLVVLGVVMLLNLGKLLSYIQWGGSATWPTNRNFIYAISIAMVAYIGLESVSQMAEEAKEPQKMVPRSLMLAVVTVLIMYAGISTVALSAMSPQELADKWSTDPIAGVAHYLPDIPLWGGKIPVAKLMAPWVAILAASILLIATNAGLLGVSRLAFSMGQHHQLPQFMIRLHQRFRTPYLSIAFFSVVAMVLLLPSFFEPGILLKLGDLYSFGAMLAFTIAHASIIALRIKEPNLERPFKLRGVVKIKDYEIPLTAILGFLSTLAVWVVVVITHPWGRNVGIIWTFAGIIAYIIYRRREGYSLLKTVKVEKTYIEV